VPSTGLISPGEVVELAVILNAAQPLSAKLVPATLSFENPQDEGKSQAVKPGKREK
jgi:hypothetical protein